MNTIFGVIILKYKKLKKMKCENVYSSLAISIFIISAPKPDISVFTSGSFMISSLLVEFIELFCLGEVCCFWCCCCDSFAGISTIGVLPAGPLAISNFRLIFLPTAEEIIFVSSPILFSQPTLLNSFWNVMVSVLLEKSDIVPAPSIVPSIPSWLMTVWIICGQAEFIVSMDSSPLITVCTGAAD